MLHVSCDGHLFEELRGLGQVGFSVEVGYFEDAGAAFCGGACEIGGLDEGEAVVAHVVDK